MVADRHFCGFLAYSVYNIYRIGGGEVEMEVQVQVQVLVLVLVYAHAHVQMQTPCQIPSPLYIDPCNTPIFRAYEGAQIQGGVNGRFHDQERVCETQARYAADGE